MKRTAHRRARLALWLLAGCLAMPQAVGAGSEGATALGRQTTQSQTIVTGEAVTAAADDAAPANATSVESLPAGAQATISAVLGRDDARYHAETTAERVTLTNHDHRLTTVFTRDGVTIQRQDAAPVGMALTAVGVGGTLAPVARATPVAATNRVEYVRGPLTEWYVNGPVGLEQGFTLQARPAQADGPLTLAMTLTGPGTPALEGETNVVTWEDGLSYGGLFAVDAKGRELPASLALDGRTLRIDVDDDGATYPITIDPWLQQAKLTVGGPAESQFGTSVALSGDTALVGAPGSDTAYVFTRSGTVWSEEAQLRAAAGSQNAQFGWSVALEGDTALVGARATNVDANGDQGAAYVFTRSTGVWTEQAVLTAEDGAEGDQFGFSVALEGDTALIGAWTADWGDSGSTNRGAAYVFTGSGATWSQQAKLIPDDGFFQDQFGFSVALSGDGNIALVGSHNAGALPRVNHGAAYVYTRSNAVWSPAAKLIPEDNQPGDFFGESVALSFAGDVALIGAARADVGDNSQQGAAYVFTGSGANWSEQAKLIADVGAPGDRFGRSVALSDAGDTAVVAAPVLQPGAPPMPGAAYVFTGSGTDWSQQARLTASDGPAGNRFGYGVALDGDTALVGSPAFDAAYVFTGSGADWTEEAKLAPTGAPNGHFGTSVAVEGDTALVGAESIGAAYVFTRSGAVWTEQAVLRAEDASSPGRFGFSVALAGDTAVVGAWTEDWGDSASTNRGAAYVFVRSGETWSQQARLTASDAWFQEQFGNAVALSADGNIALIGCHNDGANQIQNQGAAYIFTRSADVWTEQVKLVADDGVQGDFFGESVALSAAGDVALVGAARADPGGNSVQGAAYIFSGSGTAWSQQAKLVANDGAAGEEFGQSVALSDEGDNALVGAPGPSGQGAAYTFVSAGAAWNQEAKLIADEGTAVVRFGRGVALEGDTALVGGRIADAEGMTYVFTRSGDMWSHQDTLAADDGVPDDGFAVSVNLHGAVALSGNTALVGAPLADIAANVDQGAAYVFVLEDEAADCDGDGMSNQDELRYGLDPCSATDEDGPDGDPDGDGEPNGDEIAGDPPSHPRGFYVQHFAEGATGSFYQTDIGVLNASRDAQANVLVTLLPETGAEPISVWQTLDPLQRMSVDANEQLGGAEIGVSARVESDQPIGGMRQMFWNRSSSTYGSALERGQPDSSTRWLFAEGATYVFDVFFLIENPNREPANVTVQYLRGEGQGGPVTRQIQVPASSRQTIWANADEALQNVEFAAVITSDLPIVAERSMFLNFTGQLEAGQTGAGVTDLSTTWHFAEAATQFFDTFLLLGNPGDTDAQVTVTYQFQDATTLVKEYTVFANTRQTVLLDTEDPRLAEAIVAMTVESTQPIIAERAMWWGPSSASWYEAHTSVGSTDTGTVWVVGEARTGGLNADDAYVLLSNDTTTPAQVQITLIYDDGSTEQEMVEVAAQSRMTRLLTTDFPGSEGRRYSILVESVGEAAVPITVDASRYQSTNSIFGNAGGTALATRIQ